MADDPTLRFYDDNAAAYAGRARRGPTAELAAFLDALPPRGNILELGTGGGQDARVILDRGFDLLATDGSPGLAAQAAVFLAHPVRVMRFDQLDADAAFDGVWAAASLLHAPAAELPAVLARVHRALRPSGLFVASFKAGDGPGHDQFGRYYNYPTADALRADYAAAAVWSTLELTETAGSGYDNMPTRWLWVRATR